MKRVIWLNLSRGKTLQVIGPQPRKRRKVGWINVGCVGLVLTKTDTDKEELDISYFICSHDKRHVIHSSVIIQNMVVQLNVSFSPFMLFT